jgi:hypothetical protein
LRQATRRRAPAEAFLDAPAQPPADRLAKACRDFGRDGGLTDLAMLAHRPGDHNMRLDLRRLQSFDKGLGVVVLVGAKRRALGLAGCFKRAAASRSAVPVANVASAAATSPLRFSINAWPR